MSEISPWFVETSHCREGGEEPVEAEKATQSESEREWKFEVRERVFVRNYRHCEEKWLPGVIKQKTGPVSLLVEFLVDDIVAVTKPHPLFTWSRPSLGRCKAFCVSAEVRRRFLIINRAKGKVIAVSRDKKSQTTKRGGFQKSTLYTT